MSEIPQQFSQSIIPNSGERKPSLRDFVAYATHLAMKTGSLFADPEFPASDSTLYDDPLKLPAYATKIEWLRPHEIHQQATLNFNSTKSVKQGTLGDCWLLGAVLSLQSSHL